MANSSIPAPERDLQNVGPHVPPASREPGMISQAIFGSLSVGMGIALVVIGVVAALFNASPLPRELFTADEMMAALFAGLSGLCLIGCGIGIFRRATGVTLVLFALALACGAVAGAM